MKEQIRSFYDSAHPLKHQLYTDDLVAATGFGRENGKPEEDWGRSSSNPYLITSAAQFKLFAEEINNDNQEHPLYKGLFFRLTTDIYINSSVWQPIGFSSSSSFKGYLDGNGYTVWGELKGENRAFGLFGFLRGATIANLQVAVSLSVGSGSLFVGVIAGYADNVFIENCVVSGSVSGEGVSQYVGGVVGGLFGSLSVVSGCSFSGGIEWIYTSQSSYLYLGGIVGYFTFGSVTGCSMTGRVSGTTLHRRVYVYVGGIAGIASSSISRCTVSGIVSGKGGVVNAGGIAGCANSSTVTLLCCVSRGEVVGCSTSTNRIGGVVGESFGTLHACHNYGNVLVVAGLTNAVGGLIGYNTASGMLYDCSKNHVSSLRGAVGGGNEKTDTCLNKEHQVFLA